MAKTRRTPATPVAGSLPLESRILVGDNGHEHEASWADFIKSNHEDLGMWELAKIAVRLQAGEIYEGGGGAEGKWSVRLTPPTLTIKVGRKQYPIPDFATASRLVDKARDESGIASAGFAPPL